MNDALTRDLAGQSAPSFLTLAYAIYSPADRELVVANGGHNPLLVFGPGGLREFPSRGSMLGVRADLEFPEDRARSSSPATPSRCSPTASPRRATTAARCSARQRLAAALARRRGHVGRAPLDSRLAGRGRLPRRRARRPTTPRCCWAASLPIEDR